MSRGSIRLVAGCLAVCVSTGFAADRPAEWAEPVKLEGVENFHRVAPGFYRSREPSRRAMRRLQKFGIKTVINLREFHSDRKEMKGTVLLEERVKMRTWGILDADVITVLRKLRRKEDGPFLVHCQHGADRTGLITAMYRIVEQKWSKEAAIKEMVEGGYGFHSMWKNIIRYVEKVDAEKIRRAVDA